MNTPTGACTIPLNIAFNSINYWIAGWFYANTTEDGTARTRYHATFPNTISSFTIGTYSATNNRIRYIAIGY